MLGGGCLFRLQGSDGAPGWVAWEEGWGRSEASLLVRGCGLQPAQSAGRLAQPPLRAPPCTLASREAGISGRCSGIVDMASGSVGTKQSRARFASGLSLDSPEPRQRPQQVLRTRRERGPSHLVCETSIGLLEAGAWSLQHSPRGMRPDACVTISHAHRVPCIPPHSVVLSPHPLGRRRG